MEVLKRGDVYVNTLLLEFLRNLGKWEVNENGVV